MMLRNVARLLMLVVLLGGWMKTPMAAPQVPPPARTLTLKETLRIASARDVRLIISAERVQQALARIEQSRSSLFPQLDMNASQKRQTRDLRTAGIGSSADPLAGPFNTFDARAEVTQSIFDPAAAARLKEAQGAKALSQARLRETREDVLALVAVLFVEARRGAESLEYARAVVQRDEKKFAIAQSRKEAGLASDIEVKQARADMDAALRLREYAVGRALETRLDLLSALGFDPEQTIEFVNDDEWTLPEASMEPAAADVEQLPKIAAAREELKVSELNRRVQQSEFFPKLSALADYGPSGVDPGNQNETYMFGVQASFPFLDGGLRKARVKEAESAWRVSQATLQDTRRRAQSELLKTRRALVDSQALVAQKFSEWAVAKEELSLARQRRRDGTASEVDWLTALAKEAGARDEANEARALLLTSQINRIHAEGNMERYLE